MELVLQLIGKLANYAGDPEATSAITIIFMVLATLVLGFVLVCLFLLVRYLLLGTTKPIGAGKHRAEADLRVESIQHAVSQRFLDELRDIVDSAVEKGLDDKTIHKMVTEAAVSKSKQYPNNPFIRNAKKPETLKELTREFIEDALLIKGIKDDVNDPDRAD